MKKLSVKSISHEEMVDITSEIQSMLKSEKIENGIAIIYIPHTTAAVTINEGADPDVQYDIINHLQKIIPHNAGYRHSEGNSDAHIKASMLGSSQTILINNNQLVLGTWQHIFFYEGDGPRNRVVYVDFLSK